MGNILVYIFAISIIVLFAGNILFFLVPVLFHFLRDKKEDLIHSFKDKFGESVTDEYQKYFLGKFSYYDKLPDQLKLKFLFRVRKFVRSKSYEGRQELIVTEEMKVMIASSAVQLTFGLEEFILEYFSEIIVYPEKYYSPITGKYHVGEANPKGVLVISWKDFKRGYDLPDDAINVGLHETAHALELAKRLGGRYDEYFSEYYEKWINISEEEFEKVNDGEDSFLRKYAGTNRHEFFAVCIEHFFEESVDFKNELPELYYHLCILLNQDPLANDTKVKSLKNKNYTEMLEESSVSQILLRTGFSILSFPFIATVPILFCIFIIMFAKMRILDATLIVSVIVFSFFIIPYVNAGRIVIYDKYIGIDKLNGELRALYPLDGILSVSFKYERNGDYIEICIAKEGKIYKNSFSFFSKAGEKDEIIKLLRDRNVFVNS